MNKRGIVPILLALLISWAVMAGIIATEYAREKQEEANYDHLALPPIFFNSIHANGQSDKDRKNFLREYNWLMDLLKQKYPDHEFIILPVQYEKTPPGWTWVPFGWRGHLIYRRPIKEAA